MFALRSDVDTVVVKNSTLLLNKLKYACKGESKQNEFSLLTKYVALHRVNNNESF